jgi:hypothetical protein
MLDDLDNAYTNENNKQVVHKKERWHSNVYESQSHFPREMMHSVIDKKLRIEKQQGAPQHAPGSMFWQQGKKAKTRGTHGI